MVPDLGWVVKDPLLPWLFLICHHGFWNLMAKRGTHSVQHPVQPHFHLWKDLTLTSQPPLPPVKQASTGTLSVLAFTLSFPNEAAADLGPLPAWRCSHHHPDLWPPNFLPVTKRIPDLEASGWSGMDRLQVHGQSGRMYPISHLWVCMVGREHDQVSGTNHQLLLHRDPQTEVLERSQCLGSSLVPSVPAVSTLHLCFASVVARPTSKLAVFTTCVSFFNPVSNTPRTWKLGPGRDCQSQVRQGAEMLKGAGA